MITSDVAIHPAVRHAQAQRVFEVIRGAAPMIGGFQPGLLCGHAAQECGAAQDLVRFRQGCATLERALRVAFRFGQMLVETAGIRRAGAASLDLAYVAAGRLDGFWEIGLQPWDIAAGALLVQEAGGLVSDFKGGNDYLSSGDIVAGNPKCFKALLQTVNRHLNDN